MKYILIAALALGLAGPVHSQTVAQLQAELDAQKEINALLRQRIRSLEAQLGGPAATPTATPAALPDVPAPAWGPDSAEDRALERALVRRGSAVLSAGTFEITPSLTWGHSGRDAVSSTDDTYIFGLDARAGFGDGWMIGAGTNLRKRTLAGVGSNSGFGDSNLTLWKQIAREGSSRPSIVASLRYQAPTGDDFSQSAIPLGAGFHRVSARISAVKTVDPIAFFGTASYTYSKPERFASVRFKRAHAFGIGAGASVAITPDISTTAALRFTFEDKMKRNGVPIPGSSITAGTLDLGLGVVLRQNVFMNINAAVGITSDAPDTVLSIAFPIRF